MIKNNPTPEQQTAIDHYKQLPKLSPKDYDIAQKTIQKLPTNPKPILKSIKNTSPGYHKNEVKLQPAFNALLDLPIGWSAVSMYDSGGNHKILNAGSHMLRMLYNTQSSH